MSEWDGRERRDYPELRAIIRDELKDDLKRIVSIEKKMSQWETGAWVFRWFFIVTAGLITAATGVLDWMREHLK